MYRMERDSFDGPNEAAEMHRKAFNLGKKRAFSVEMCFENESVRSKVMPRNVGVGLKDRGWADRKSLGWSCASWVSVEKNDTSHFLGLSGRRQCCDHCTRL